MTAGGRQTLSVSSSAIKQQEVILYSTAQSGSAVLRNLHKVIAQALLTQAMEDQHAG